MDQRRTVNDTYAVEEIHPCYTQHGRAFTFHHIYSFKCVLLYVFLGLLSVVTVSGNILVIISVVYFKQLHVPTNYLILSLALADLFVGVLVFPFSMAFTITSCWYQEDLLCKIRGSLDVTLSTASILNLCCISVDRYYAVCHPLTYRSKINHTIIRVMILVSWGVAVFIGTGIIVAGFNQGKCDGDCLIDALISTTLACVFSFYIPVIIMLSIYLKIYLVAQRQAKKILKKNFQIAKPAAIASKTETKATKTLAIVMGVFLMCWTPFFICIVFQPLAYKITPISVIEALNWLALSNSMLNPFIYAFFYSWFRSAFRIIISGKIFYNDSANFKLISLT